MRDIEALKAALTGLGATKVAHQEGTLLDHLESTLLVLEQMKCPEHVCLAGLFHGAYGTQALHSDKIGAVTNEHRRKIQALIGGKAERLVFCFSIMTYESLGKSFRAVLKADGQPALRDRRNGELLPMSRAEFDELLYLKLADVMAHMPTRASKTQLHLRSEHAFFWQLVAEHLGDRAVEAWNIADGGWQ